MGVCPQRKEMVTLYAGRSLKEHLKHETKTNYMEVVMQMALTLEFVGKCNYVHNCICLDNFCINQDSNTGKIMVSLVGFGRQCQVTGTCYYAYHHNRHYPPHPSPELKRGERSLTPASDVYSFALLLYTGFRSHRVGYITREWVSWVLSSRRPEERPSLEELRKVIERFYHPQPQRVMTMTMRE